MALTKLRVRTVDVCKWNVSDQITESFFPPRELWVGRMHSPGKLPPTEPPPDRRSEPRFAIGADARLRRQGDGRAYAAITLNVSTGGLLLRFSESNPCRVGDDVECEIALADAPQQAFASWGVGRVVRIDESSAAVVLRSGLFTAADET